MPRSRHITGVDVGEQKWASRIDQILGIASTTPPRDPNDDDDEDEDEEDEDQPDEPAVVREPDED